MLARSSAILVCFLLGASVAAAVTVAPGWTLAPYVQATGAALRYAMGQAWDSNGDYYVNEGGAVSTLYKFKKSALPFSGSLDPSSSALQFSKAYGLSDNADGLVFRNNRLYIAQATSNRIIEVDPNTGAILRTVATQSYPLDIKVDPLSGDLFFSSLARNAAGGIYRISDVEGPNPILTKYGAVPDGVDGLSFAADGTIYASLYFQSTLLKISRPNDSPPVVSTFATGIPFPDGTAVGKCDGQEVLIAVSASDQAVYQYTLTDPPVKTNVVTAASSKLDFAFVGPDNAFYISQHGDPTVPHTVVLRLFNPNCVFTQPPSNPPGACGANCPAKTVSNACETASFTSSGTCASLDFSNTVQSC